MSQEKQTAEEVLLKHTNVHSNWVDCDVLDVLDAMEEYATQCQEDNADKKYTEDDLHNLLRARRQLYSHTDKNVVRDFINSLNKQD